MHLALLAVLTWTDVPALVTSATAPVDAELKACSKKPVRISLHATRDLKTDDTHVSMPVYGVGYRGLSPEEKCLGAAVPKIALPVLPAGVESVLLGYPMDGTDKAWNDWRDLPAALGAVLTDEHRAGLAACSTKPRTVRIILDLTHGKTRVWLPAWQFHSASGDGTTPPAQRRVKACLTRAIASWRPPVLPRPMGELDLAVDVSP